VCQDLFDQELRHHNQRKHDLPRSPQNQQRYLERSLALAAAAAPGQPALAGAVVVVAVALGPTRNQQSIGLRLLL